MKEQNQYSMKIKEQTSTLAAVAQSTALRVGNKMTKSAQITVLRVVIELTKSVTIPKTDE
ncbi:hypothetical protein [Streptococcus pneumoniae]|uniref:hypothetical protein n=1 Tax=Streptococcus pneumoniae TaxID=1313 RepID=UPI001157EECB|nr:hypothetical protein [Streptococcus pneumoniae]